ncbi:MAG: hypothetical protein ACKO2W_00725 [Vulcanococcus sp.]
MAFFPILLGLASLGVSPSGPWLNNVFDNPHIVGVPGGGFGPSGITSPWWEDYDIKERYLCTEKGGVMLERNGAQAALISGGSRATLFREPNDAPALIYRNDHLRVILRGDELTVERFPLKISCVRSEEV